MPIHWCDTCRYVGVYLTCAKKIKLILTMLNLIFTRISMASWPRLVTQHHTMLWFSCFVPSVCAEACNPANKVVKSLDYVTTCAFSKIFACNHPKSLQTANLPFVRQNVRHYYYTPIPQRKGSIPEESIPRFLSGLTKPSTC